MSEPAPVRSTPLPLPASFPAAVRRSLIRALVCAPAAAVMIGLASATVWSTGYYGLVDSFLIVRFALGGYVFGLIAGPVSLVALRLEQTGAPVRARTTVALVLVAIGAAIVAVAQKHYTLAALATHSPEVARAEALRSLHQLLFDRSDLALLAILETAPFVAVVSARLRGATLDRQRVVGGLAGATAFLGYLAVVLVAAGRPIASHLVAVGVLTLGHVALGLIVPSLLDRADAVDLRWWPVGPPDAPRHPEG